MFFLFNEEKYKSAMQFDLLPGKAQRLRQQKDATPDND